jgi:uncharacterized lipoprotein YmbA
MKTILLALVCAAIPADAAEIAGTWRLTGRVADVNIDRVCTIRQTESRIQGACKNQSGETVLSGEVNGGNITWKYESKYDGATVVLVFKGTLESDTAIKGTITASDTAGNNSTTGTFNAKRE